MNRTFYQTLLVLLLLFQNRNVAVAQPNPVIESFISGFTRPVKVTNAYDSRLFVGEIGGRIKIVKNGTLLSEPFLDISSKINDPDWAGIYSFVFAPNYQTSGYFYVMYVLKNSPQVQISRFSRSISNPDKADESSELQILTIPYEDVAAGHRGGDLAFGKDGYLYISTGDNGPGSRGDIGDPNNNSQNLNKLFGKILKIDVNSAAPADNILDKIFALGLRNPWRFSFDRSTGDLWIGDNGQDAWEEVNYLQYPFGQGLTNFGWRCMEGNENYPYAPVPCEILPSHTPPKYLFAGFSKSVPNTDASVMGGYVYRGSKYRSFTGYYFFGNYSTGKIGFVSQSGTGSFHSTLSYPSIISFGEDVDGELYVLSFLNGTLSKITNPAEPLPVKLEYLTAKQENCVIQLTWRTSLEVDFSRFEVEHSTDARTFSKTNSITQSGANHIYTIKDEKALPDSNFYRLKMINNDGSFQYSSMVSINLTCPEREISLFPNPATDKVTFKGVRKGYEISLYNLSGIMIFTTTQTTNEQAELSLKNFPAGVYTVIVKDPGSEFAKQLKLVKK